MISSATGRQVFTLLRSSGRRGHAGALTVVRAPRPDHTEPEVAFAIGRRVGSAVRRNRLRRQLRAIMADLDAAGELGGDAYLLVMRPHEEWPNFATLSEWTRRALAATR